MKKTQLAAAVLLATGSASALAATYEITPLPVEDISQNNFASSIDNTGAMLTSVGEEFSPVWMWSYWKKPAFLLPLKVRWMRRMTPAPAYLPPTITIPSWPTLRQYEARVAKPMCS